MWRAPMMWRGFTDQTANGHTPQVQSVGIRPRTRFGTVAGDDWEQTESPQQPG